MINKNADIMKKILVFLLGCAVGAGCWHAFFKTDSAKAEQEVTVVEDTVNMAISVKKELQEVGDVSVEPEDSLMTEPEMAE